MPAAFTFEGADIFLPLAFNRTAPQPRTAHYLAASARLRDGATVSEARAQLRTLASGLRRDYSDAYLANMNFGLGTESLTETLVGSARPALLLLLGAVALLLLVACANVANLLLVRAEGRRREFAVRQALGAGRGRLVRQLLTEGALLALSGGLLGLLLASLAVPALIAASPESLPRHEEIGIDPFVCAVTFGLAVVTGLMCSIAPALQATRPGVQTALKEGGERGGTGTRRGLRSTIVVVELALAAMLVIGAALLLQSFWQLRAVNLGFRPDHVLTFDVSLPESRYADTVAVLGLYDELLAGLGTLPGVQATGAVANLPLTGRTGNWDVELDGRPLMPGDPAPSPKVNIATPGYYTALRVPVVRGRPLDASDDERGAPVALINETMARTLWPAADPVGRRFRVLGDSTPWMTIVGIARDTRSWNAEAFPEAEYTLPYAQLPFTLRTVRRAMTIVVRSASDPLALAAPIRKELAALDRDLAPSSMRTLDQVVSASIAPRRFTMFLLVLFGLVALALAIVGIYGVTAYGVAQRTREMGIRLALGASPFAVRRLVVGQGMQLIVTGIALGLVLSLVGARALRSQLYGVGATDMRTYLVLSAVLLVVALIAMYLPARQATRADPTVTLRAE